MSRLNIWKILGISKTKDKNKIRRAYAKALKNSNPEEKPEEFKKLRKAFEEAIEFADYDYDYEEESFDIKPIVKENIYIENNHQFSKNDEEINEINQDETQYNSELIKFFKYLKKAENIESNTLISGMKFLLNLPHLANVTNYIDFENEIKNYILYGEANRDELIEPAIFVFKWNKNEIGIDNNFLLQNIFDRRKDLLKLKEFELPYDDYYDAANAIKNPPEKYDMWYKIKHPFIGKKISSFIKLLYGQHRSLISHYGEENIQKWCELLNLYKEETVHQHESNPYIYLTFAIFSVAGLFAINNNANSLSEASSNLLSLILGVIFGISAILFLYKIILLYKHSPHDRIRKDKILYFIDLLICLLAISLPLLLILYKANIFPSLITGVIYLFAIFLTAYSMAMLKMESALSSLLKLYSIKLIPYFIFACVMIFHLGGQQNILLYLCIFFAPVFVIISAQAMPIINDLFEAKFINIIVPIFVFALSLFVFYFCYLNYADGDYRLGLYISSMVISLVLINELGNIYVFNNEYIIAQSKIVGYFVVGSFYATYKLISHGYNTLLVITGFICLLPVLKIIFLTLANLISLLKKIKI